ncbi:unnamed protein product, partial [marine sediment metagenome]
ETILRLADYFIERKRLEGKIKQDSKNAKKREDMLVPFKDEFRNFVILYYCERLDENIHLYAINKKFSTYESHRLEHLTKGHPFLKDIDVLQKYRLEDINHVLSFLLGTRYGREKILKSFESSTRPTKYFEKIRLFFERSGISGEEEYKEENGGDILDI